MWRLKMFVGCLLAGVPMMSCGACHYTIGYDFAPIPPFINPPDSEGHRSAGSAIDLVSQAASVLGCSIHWQPLPNMRVFHLLSNNQIDGAILYSWNPERDQLYIYPKRDGKVDSERRIATLNYVLYRKKGSTLQWDGLTYTQLSCPIGFNEGWSIGADLDHHGVMVESAKDAEQNLKKLEKGRICGYATLEEAGDSAIAHYPGALFEKLSVPFSRKEYYLLFNQTFYRNHSQQIETLWSQIGKLRDSK